MENASKALMMIAEVLVGVMIISIGVYLFNEMGKYSAETTSKIEDTQIAQFNAQFLRYYGKISTDEGTTTDIPCTIHDIVGLANLANKINAQGGYTETENHPLGSPSDSSGYVQISLKTDTGTYRNLENETSDELIELIKQNDTIVTGTNPDNIDAEIKYFKCTGYYIAANTGMVNYMEFEEF